MKGRREERKERMRLNGEIPYFLYCNALIQHLILQIIKLQTFLKIHRMEDQMERGREEE